MQQEIVISDVTTLKSMVHEINLFQKKKKKIKVEFEFLNEEENKQLQNKIQKYYSACGCSQGRMTGVFTLLAYAGFLFTGIISVYKLGIGNTILLYFACSIITMTVGKIYGLQKARRSLLHLANELELKFAINNKI